MITARSLVEMGIHANTRPLALAVFMYHGVHRARLPVSSPCFLNENAFRDQIGYIREKFEVVPLKGSIDRLRAGSSGRPLAALTFDDGFWNHYEVVFPILREAGLPATLFPVTGLVDSRDTVWYCRVLHALGETEAGILNWNGCRFALSGKRARAHAAEAIHERLKPYAHPRLLQEVARICAELGVDPKGTLETDSPFRMLDWPSIEKMARSGFIDFGAHTHSHAILSLLSPEDQRREIRQSATALSEMTQQPISLFAYPNGRRSDYNKETLAILREEGVDIAVTAEKGLNVPGTARLELRRLAFHPSIPNPLFRLQVQGAVLRHRVVRAA